MIASCLFSFALGLALGLRYKAMILILVQIPLGIVALGALVLTSAAFHTVALHFILATVSLQAAYVLSSTFARPHRQSLGLSPRRT